MAGVLKILLLAAHVTDTNVMVHLAASAYTEYLLQFITA
jgi:hypothetical protein